MLSAKLSTSDVFVIGLELIGAICLLGVVIWLIRRRLFSTGQSTTNDDQWSLQHLREMKSQGQITENEFEALKAKLLETSRLSIRREDGMSSSGG